MPFYATLADDLARAKQILTEGKPQPEDYEHFECMPEALQQHALAGGTIYGKDTYVAYKLLESFVAVIDAVGPKVCELALRHARIIDMTGRPGDIRFECPVCQWGVTLSAAAADVWTEGGAIAPRCRKDSSELSRRVIEEEP